MAVKTVKTQGKACARCLFLNEGKVFFVCLQQRDTQKFYNFSMLLRTLCHAEPHHEAAWAYAGGYWMRKAMLESTRWTRRHQDIQRPSF
ncbi:MAG: hypothetical protein JJK57_14855 [Komagataeibacter hansenii]|nr:hypothetical protein [Novacetimonas hansenii]